MKQIPRERIALVVFAAMIAIIVAGIASYLVAGHSWNYAATRIDDAAGEMDGYEMVVYEGLAIPRESRVDSDGALKFAPYPLEAAVREYRAKGAIVHQIDLAHPEAYADGVVLYKGRRRFGVLGVDAGQAPRQIQDRVDALAAHGVDLVIAIVPNQQAISQVEGIGAFIDLGERSALSTGTGSADGYRIALPETGNVGALVLSPSDVLSARTLNS